MPALPACIPFQSSQSSVHMATTTPERVDEDINKYAVLLSNLLAQKNSFLPIFRLPSETLANIFIHAACDHYDSDDGRFYFVPSWVNVSYVCRHWRNVALNCPTLWAHHFTVSPRWTKELMARSKQASLKIHIHFGYSTQPWYSCLLENVLNQVGRIRELRLEVPRHIFPTKLSLDAPRLQILDIDLSPYPPEQTLTINNGDSLPLRTLKLVHCPLPWHSVFNLSGVTTLFLWFVPSLSQLDILKFLTTLSRMPALAVLHVHHALHSARGFLSSGAFDLSRKVALPCLARLVVCDPLSTVVALLLRVDIPLTTKIRLEIEPEDASSIDDFAQLPPLVTHRFSQSENLSTSGPTIRSLIINFTYDSVFTLRASERGDCDADIPTWYGSQGRNTPFLLHVRMNRSMAINRDRIVGDICCAIPSTHVQTLQTSDPPSSSDFWRQTLGHFDGLRHIRLSCDRMPSLASLLDVLAERPEDAISDDHNPILGYTFAPTLEKLELLRITFPSQDDLFMFRALSARMESLDVDVTKCDVIMVEEDE